MGGREEVELSVRRWWVDGAFARGKTTLATCTPQTQGDNSSHPTDTVVTSDRKPPLPLSDLNTTYPFSVLFISRVTETLTWCRGSSDDFLNAAGKCMLAIFKQYYYILWYCLMTFNFLHRCSTFTTLVFLLVINSLLNQFSLLQQPALINVNLFTSLYMIFLI